MDPALVQGDPKDRLSTSPFSDDVNRRTLVSEPYTPDAPLGILARPCTPEGGGDPSQLPLL